MAEKPINSALASQRMASAGPRPVRGTSACNIAISDSLPFLASPPVVASPNHRFLSSVSVYQLRVAISEPFRISHIWFLTNVSCRCVAVPPLCPNLWSVYGHGCVPSQKSGHYPFLRCLRVEAAVNMAIGKSYKNNNVAILH